jgi:putative FmdB family regulatory protein
MPLYEYECFLCGSRFERIQRFADAPVSTCPACGGAVRRLLGVPALQFKGSGFYITDYGKGKSNGDGAPAGGTESGQAAESSTSSESPAPKKEPKKGSESTSEAKSTSS